MLCTEVYLAVYAYVELALATCLFSPLSCRLRPSLTTPTVCRTPLFEFLSCNTIAFSPLPPHVGVGVASNPRNLLLPLHFNPLFYPSPNPYDFSHLVTPLLI